ncbi:MAG: hypothetical protein HUJ54_12335 [Erysipelotrichaceae bacterium]|nr:hypothetical protein [Erysipelotrichaceae bacterium]
MKKQIAGFLASAAAVLLVIVNGVAVGHMPAIEEIFGDHEILQPGYYQKKQLTDLNSLYEGLSTQGVQIYSDGAYQAVPWDLT